MKNILLSSIVIFSGLLWACCGAAPTSEATPPADASVAGKDLVEAKCDSCHTLDKIYSTEAGAEQWTAIVEKMRELGASLTDEEALAIARHLANR
jgi:mono/diheme cytochrome c family protein